MEENIYTVYYEAAKLPLAILFVFQGIIETLTITVVYDKV